MMFQMIMGLIAAALITANACSDERKGEKMKVDVIPIQQDNNGKFLKLDLNRLPLPPDFLNSRQMMIVIPPGEIGGNHKHPRREIFISLSDDLELHWIDEKGLTHRQKMKDKNQFYLFNIHPFVPHAVVNRSQSSDALLLELYDEEQFDVELFPVLSFP